MDLRICHSECQRPGKEQPSCPSQLLMDVKHSYAVVGSREFRLFKIIDEDRHMRHAIFQQLKIPFCKNECPDLR